MHPYLRILVLITSPLQTMQALKERIDEEIHEAEEPKYLIWRRIFSRTSFSIFSSTAPLITQKCGPRTAGTCDKRVIKPEDNKCHRVEVRLER